MALDENSASRLRTDYLEWSGGFPPDDEMQMFVYLEYAASVELEFKDAWDALLAWKEQSLQI